MNYTVKPNIKSQLSDAAILQCNFIYLSGFKSKKVHELCILSHGTQIKNIACTQQLATPAAICAHT